jgi:hypothetical protein
MKRDFDLLRLILLQIENDITVDLSEYSIEQINYHKALLIEAGLVEGKTHYSSMVKTEIPDRVIINKLTWEGHDFLDKAKNNNIWDKAKKLIINKGLPFSIDILKSFMLIVIKDQMNDL